MDLNQAARMLGARGGARKTEAQAAAGRANGRAYWQRVKNGEAKPPQHRRGPLPRRADGTVIRHRAEWPTTKGVIKCETSRSVETDGTTSAGL